MLNGKCKRLVAYVSPFKEKKPTGQNRRGTNGFLHDKSVACLQVTDIKNCTWAKNEMKEFFCLCYTCSIMHDNESVFFSVNSWSSLSVKEPLLTAKNTVFFKIVELAYTQGTVLCMYYISCNFIFILF